MCDSDNSQDKKMLLLAELVEHKCNALAGNQKNLQNSLDNTNDKLDKLTELLEKYEADVHGCPVYHNRPHYEKISFYVKNPKTTLLMIIGFFALMGGFFGSTLTEVIRSFIGI